MSTMTNPASNPSASSKKSVSSQVENIKCKDCNKELTEKDLIQCKHTRVKICEECAWGWLEVELEQTNREDCEEADNRFV